VGGKGERRNLGAGLVIGAVRVEGTPYEMGWRHGRLLTQEIRDRLRVPIEASILPALTAYARQMRPLLPVGVEEELRGIGAGAGVSADELFLREVEREGSRWHQEEAPLLQAALVVPVGTPATVLAAYYRVEYAPVGRTWVVLERHPTGGVATLGLAWPGSVGLVAGLSSSGLLAAEGEVPGVLPERRSLHGMPFTVGLRVALERAVDVSDLVERLPRLLGNRVAAADRHGGRMLSLLHLGAPSPTLAHGWAFAPMGAFVEDDVAWKRQEAAAWATRSGPAEEQARAVLLAGGGPGAPSFTVTLSAARGLTIEAGSALQTFALVP